MAKATKNSFDSENCAKHTLAFSCGTRLYENIIKLVQKY
jgi:hypothetical protein